MRGVGTLINVATVVAGTLLGTLIGRRLPAQLRATLLQAVGLVTVVVGVSEATETRNVVFPLVAVVLGGAVGEILGLEERLAGLGERVRRRLQPVEADGSTFVEGFVAASLLFCVGPLTILGSIQDGLGGSGHAQLLIVKASLDGLVAVVFASTLGWGVGLSALVIAVLQGTITLGAGAADHLLSDRMVVEMSAAGGVMVIGIALRLLDLKQVRVASLLPGLIIAPATVALFVR
jgi:uncharacterized membrane protein YqgA involved in biofilm formation